MIILFYDPFGDDFVLQSHDFVLFFQCSSQVMGTHLTVCLSPLVRVFSTCIQSGLQVSKKLFTRKIQYCGEPS